ncbi:asparagine synthase (glutamine-hydrolyzing) [Sphingomonas sabuli]|uniref:asparagine synthase (glutamine-hydrolyzing) n=1 Tax=Sphingomonas sabuli TaxID=2764186 RepID=A0A7G9L3E5_9SPHN|nr:asparagine synthase (glutamine-hydrolyzing) [Sphingomonas sabuli]QNM83144.1 asparagine synthase (glutamine-hydrolyzing) [Sphingomonas sabuli]
MCGIAGFVGGEWPGREVRDATLQAMCASIRYRGPDHSATWMDADARVGFAHNRLAIVDLSPAGNQPMHSHSGRFVTAYNGEIYNHLDIRSELESIGKAPPWAGHSDTETLLAAVEAWGIRGTLERATGMFAIALWDRQERRLVLARDRLGEKPLYYGRQQGGAGPFLFGSELKALRCHPQFEAEVDRDALTLLLRFNYIPAPHSIYRGISKLMPGTFLTLRGDAAPEIETYWSVAEAAERGVADRLFLSDGDAVDALEAQLDRAIGGQMLADVPLGAFLSGGVDSSAVVAIMQKLSPRPVRTFTIGYEDRNFNEADDAKAVARHLGTDHSELYITADEARAVIPRLPQIYDEPFADSSQIPTHLVSALARQDVTVALSGDGGDEVFGGYNRYLYTAKLWDRISRVPKPMRRAAARALVAVPASAWTGLGNATGIKVRQLGEKIHKGAPLLRGDSAEDVYAGTISIWQDPGSAVIGGTEPPNFTTGATPDLHGLGPIDRMMALDMLGYLPGDILTKVDRAAMAVSLETRVPFLDHQLIEFAWRLPIHQKIRDGKTKWILRQLLYRHVPERLIERPKMGFGIPVGDWLRGPLRQWSEDFLDERRLRDEGFFRPEPIQRLWRDHLSGHRDLHGPLWGVLMFQSWLETQGPVAAQGAGAPELVSDASVP